MPTNGFPHILLVEDNEDDALLLQHDLRRSLPEAQFFRVDDEASMRAALEDRTWDMVICDHGMPKFDSAQALQVLRDAGLEIPFVIYSGQFDQERAAAAMMAGARDFIDKHETARLRPVVERELRTYAERRARERAESSLAELARFDPLTRLPNRDFLTEVLERSLRDYTPGTTPALLCIDLDRLMRVNESFGYAAGDSLLRQIATHLRQLAGPGDFVARLGQDKFAVFSPRCIDPHQGRLYAERLARELGQPYKLHGQDIFITLSMGLGLYPDHGPDALSLLRNAESAMATAKRKGGNRVQIYQRDFNAGSSRRFMLENAMRHAVQRREFFLHYQPVMLLDSGRIAAVEALVRWHHPELGQIAPDQFIPIAEETGMVVEIGEWVLREACRQIGSLHNEGFADLGVAVNFSSNQFQLPDAAARVANILDEVGLDPRHLEIEITESIAMEDGEASIETLGALKATGAKIAIDDFGTGYSSLSYLRRFPIDILKIDQSFMRDVPNSEENAAIVKSIAALAHSLRLVLHAEGVETTEQYEFLRGLGCDRVQGYLLHRPLALGDLKAMLRRFEPKPVLPWNEAARAETLRTVARLRDERLPSKFVGH